MILDVLKQRTRPQHESIERNLDLLDGTTTLTQYRALLGAFYGFYAPLEARIANTIAATQLDFDYEPRRKTPNLHADLSALGLDSAQIARLPLCANLPDVSNAARVFGYLYVAEGSTLGGQIISRHFAQALGVSMENDGAFFQAHGAQTGAMWREFQYSIERFAQGETQFGRIGESVAHETAVSEITTDETTENEIVAAACETFSCLETWLKTTLVKIEVIS